MYKKFITRRILKNFFFIDLTPPQKRIALQSIDSKYGIALRNSLIYGLLYILPILFLDVSIIVTILIPITMVAGTAWFSISLANIKQKFETFGIELTKDLFEAFTTSLILLFLLSIFFLTDNFWTPLITNIPYYEQLYLLSIPIAIIINFIIVYKIFSGALKYDINDSMLAGQNEAAEIYFRRALSLVNNTVTNLQSGKSLQVANYFIGVSFFEIFTQVQQYIDNDKIKKAIDTSTKLIKTPALNQKLADNLAIQLIQTFLSFCNTPKRLDTQKSFQAIKDELDALESNSDEDQHMIDTRLGFVFQEISNLIELEGENLFKQ